ncbi:hypothetical protein N7447_003961 [Penicillium robsamsonii]|uniref:uncharacterized protein n=1 Tax=Penicillium robsamsonii TaxID=1792511 RepID=UPI0025490D1E|nr:uncharacterized protein N7447_003961 [Penicillium robsamsonii]KAJ5827198.1 hypothetical protein N7447_003961 [Penicillium robsamsonii]
MSKPNSPDEKYSICERQVGVRKGTGDRVAIHTLSNHTDRTLREREKKNQLFAFYLGLQSPKRAMAVDGIDLAAYEIEADRTDHTPQCGLPRDIYFSSQRRMVKGITVHHQLKVELVTGEDVFHKGTGKLVNGNGCGLLCILQFH